MADKDKAPQGKEQDKSVPKAKPKVSLDSEVQRLAELEKKRVEVERTVERLKLKQNEHRHKGRGIDAQALEPEIRLAHSEHLDLFPAQQKQRNKLAERLQRLTNERQADKASEMHRQMAGEYRKLHKWATKSHMLTKSKVFSAARHDFHLKAQEHDRQAIDPDRAKR
jgi:hypothetical protein